MAESYETILLREPADLTAVTLTVALQAHYPDATVKAVTVDPLADATRCNAQLRRVHLSYARTAPELPSTLIAKLPTADTTLRGSAAVFQPGKKETTFYQQIAARTPVNAPRCYYSALDPLSGASILLLEDLRTSRGGRQFDHVTLSQAEDALTAIAQLHATWWMRDEVATWWGDDPAAPPAADDDPGAALVQALFRAAWPRFAATYAAIMPPAVAGFGMFLCDHLPAMERHAVGVPRTLLHGDFRLDNLFFAGADKDAACWIIDWEDIDFGCGMFDLAWFIGGGVDVSDAADEAVLLGHYHDALRRAGVTSYDRAACLADYRRAMVAAFAQGVLMAMTRRAEESAQRDAADDIARRFIKACTRLRLHELAPL
ncbi:MAG: aminoglycoside phosphotransferase family protein [Caldilineaceae bacterium]|nr:aminoglycoside phosphotransferase family protein [Caldilineaceae bacterium]